MNVGEKIRQERIKKGLTQEELGKILGVQKSAIAKYEKGRVVNIKRSTLEKMADFFGLRPSELFFEDKKEKTTQMDGLTDAQKKLIAFAESVPEDKIDLVLKVMQSIVEAD